MSLSVEERRILRRAVEGGWMCVAIREYMSAPEDCDSPDEARAAREVLAAASELLDRPLAPDELIVYAHAATCPRGLISATALNYWLAALARGA